MSRCTRSLPAERGAVTSQQPGWSQTAVTDPAVEACPDSGSCSPRARAMASRRVASRPRLAWRRAMDRRRSATTRGSGPGAPPRWGRAASASAEVGSSTDTGVLRIDMMRAGDLDLDHLVFQREGREQMLPVPLSAALHHGEADPTLVLDGAGDARHPAHAALVVGRKNDMRTRP